MSTIVTRRTVVRQLILGSAFSCVGGVMRSHSVLAAESPGVESVGALVLSTSQFPELAAVGGSVRLNVGLEYPIVVSRGPSDAFYAVSTRCQHLGCIVNAYDPASGFIRCGCHGSLYRIDGALAGGPAERALDAYPVVFDGLAQISVSLPGVTFAARRLVVESVASNAMRLRIDFNPLLFSTYQLQFRAELSDAPATVPFSLTPGGAADQTSYTNRNIADPFPTVALYVDLTGGRGFFNVILLVTPY